MSAREDFGTLAYYDSDRVALERAGKKEVLKVCLAASSCSRLSTSCHHH
jgi:hypothetical protein